MEISQNIEIIGLALWFKNKKTFLISDVHLGYEEEWQQKGFLLPKSQLQEIIKNLEVVLKKVKPQKIIINGDLKHEFGRVLKQEWKEVLQLIDFLFQHCQELILVKGNHDLILGPIAARRKIKLVDYYLLGENLLVHGDDDTIVKKVDWRRIKRVIIGHEHPAISLTEKSKVEKFKCFLKGRWQGKELIVLPSINPLLEGTNILREPLLSPFLSDIGDFEVYAVGEMEVFNFGKVKSFLSPPSPAPF